MLRAAFLLPLQRIGKRDDAVTRQSQGGQGPPAPPMLDQVSPARAPGKERSYSLIGASLTIIGDLRSEGDLQIDGHVCGNIRCAQLIVGKDAVITGTITAEQAVVRGKLTGTIRSPLVVLQDTALVESEIAYSLLAIDEGASFEGAARHRADPLLDEDPVSSLSDLKQMLAKPEAATAAGAGKACTSRATAESEALPQSAASDE